MSAPTLWLHRSTIQTNVAIRRAGQRGEPRYAVQGRLAASGPGASARFARILAARHGHDSDSACLVEIDQLVFCSAPPPRSPLARPTARLQVLPVATGDRVDRYGSTEPVETAGSMPIRSQKRMTAKEQLRDAIDALSEDEARDALRYIEVRRVDPMLAAFLAAPIDDEPVTDEEERAVADAREEYRRGEAVPLDEIRHEFE
jgi:hypothetical protein